MGENLKEVEDQLEKIVNAITSGMDPMLFVDRSNKLQKEKEAILLDLNILEYGIIENKMKVEEIKKRLSNMDVEVDREELFRAWIKKVSVQDEEVSVTYNY